MKHFFPLFHGLYDLKTTPYTHIYIREIQVSPSNNSFVLVFSSVLTLWNKGRPDSFIVIEGMYV